jgi:hypothetical protein
MAKMVLNIDKPSSLGVPMFRQIQIWMWAIPSCHLPFTFQKNMGKAGLEEAKAGVRWLA